MSHRARTALVSLAVAAFAGLAIAAAADARSIPKVKTKIAKLQVDTAGYFTIARLKDTTSNCFPGERWIQTNDFDYETSSYVNVSLKNVSIPGSGSVITSTPSKTVGTATTAGRITDYESTNNCPPTAPAALGGPPACTKLKGRIKVGLTPVEEAGDDDELVGLGGRQLGLNVIRKGGGTEPSGCAGGGPENEIGNDGANAVVTTSLYPDAPSLVLPLGVGSIKVFNLRAGKRIKRSVTVSGPCKTARYRVGESSPAPPPVTLNADGDCFVRGRFVVTIRARGKKR